MNSCIENLYQHYLANPQICTDSRALAHGALFFALKGEHFDGNKFALQAIKDGCSMAVVDDINLKDEDSCFYVKDVLETLQKLAIHHRKNLNIPVIGITGTNGKTTTKELVSTVLSKKFKTYATKGNFNNHIGVPLSILSIDKNIEIAVIEMGANHVGEIADLCQIAQPNHGMITNIGIAHLEGFGSFEGVKKAKIELYQFLNKQTDSITFVNVDDALLMTESTALNKSTYGFDNSADEQFESTPTQDFASLNWLIKNERIEIKSNLIGNYNLPNLMATICIGNYFKVPSQLIKEAIEEYLPKNQRSQLLKTQNNRLIVDAYNANPSSMKLAIENFADQVGTPKVFILGDMLELGTESKKLHQEITDHLSKFNPNKVILVGPEFKSCKTNTEWLQFNSTEEALIFLTKEKLKAYKILLKGSRGMQLEKLIETL